MKLLARDDAGVTLLWSAMEKKLLDTLTEAFPLLPADRQSLSRDPGSLPEDSQSWLHATHAAEQERQHAWLRDTLRKDRFQFVEGGWELTLPHDEVETLLQVLNHLRVGAWVRQGCPESLPGARQILAGTMTPHGWLLLLAGEIQMGLLLALDNSPDETETS